MSFPKLSVGRVLTFAVLFLITALLLKVLPIPDQYKSWFRI